MYIIGQLIYYCALRPAEIVRLRLKFINLEKGEIYVPGEISKSRRTDVIRIPIVFIEELRKLHLEKFNPNHYWFSRNLEPGTKEIAPTRLAERFRLEADKIGLGRTLYELKHTGAGKVIDKGTNIRDLQHHLRHQDLSSTEKYLNAYRSATSQEFVDNFPKL